MRALILGAWFGGATAASLRREVPASLVAHEVEHNKTSSKPCNCESVSAHWTGAAARPSKCVFIDLGAADGNTFRKFISDGYGPVGNCPSGGDWEAYLVEANPRFEQNLKSLEQQYPGKVHSMSSTAAYMCEASTSFYLDTTNHGHNYWGSSMSSTHPDVVKSGQVKVTVPTMNVIRTIMEHTVQGDWVMLKMDIEGAEWDIVPCLAKSPYLGLVDAFYLEQHPRDWNPDTTTTEAEMNSAKSYIQSRGVYMPDYFSQTLVHVNSTVVANGTVG
jgi:FkbM family methyltransferase